MGDCSITYRELRVLIGELTEMYILIDAAGDCPVHIQGWHHKSFPPNIPIEDILRDRMWQQGQPETDPVMWPLEAPPVRLSGP